MDTIFPVRLLSQLRPLLIGFRKSKGLTQRELSAMLGVTQQTYARLESNPSKASFERLYKVLNILGWRFRSVLHLFQLIQSLRIL